MSKLAENCLKIFSRGSILVSKPKYSTSELIKNWIKLTLYFEEKKLKKTYLRLEIVPKGSELFQTGLCVCSFGHKSRRLSSLGKYWTHEYIVGGMLGRKTKDYYISSDIVDEKPCSNISANILAYSLTPYTGSVVQHYPPPIEELKQFHNEVYDTKPFSNNGDDDFSEDDSQEEDENFGRKLEQKFVTAGFNARIANCYSIELIDFCNPYFKLRIRCDTIFNCRSLIHSIGEHLGCHATMTSLHLQRLGLFNYDTDPKLEKHELHFGQIKQNMLITTESCDEYLDYLQQIYPISKPKMRFI